MNKYIWIGLPIYKLGKVIPIFKIENRGLSQDDIFIAFKDEDIFKFTIVPNEILRYEFKDAIQLKNIKLDDIKKHIANEILKVIPKKTKDLESVLTEENFVSALINIYGFYITIFDFGSLVETYKKIIDEKIKSSNFSTVIVYDKIAPILIDIYKEKFADFYMSIIDTIKSKHKNINLDKEKILNVINNDNIFRDIFSKTTASFYILHYIDNKISKNEDYKITLSNKDRIKILSSLIEEIYSYIINSISNVYSIVDEYDILDDDNVYMVKSNSSFSLIDIVNKILHLEPVFYIRRENQSYKFISDEDIDIIEEIVGIDKNDKDYIIRLYRDKKYNIYIKYPEHYLKSIVENKKLLNLFKKIFNIKGKKINIDNLLKLINYYNEVDIIDGIKFNYFEKMENKYYRFPSVGKIKDLKDYYKKQEDLKHLILEVVNNEMKNNRFDLLPLLDNNIAYTEFMYAIKFVAVIAIASKFKKEFEKFAMQYLNNKKIDNDFLNKTEDFINKFYNELLEKNRFLYFLAKSDFIFNSYIGYSLFSKLGSLIIRINLIEPIVNNYQFASKQTKENFIKLLEFYFSEYIINDNILKNIYSFNIDYKDNKAKIEEILKDENIQKLLDVIDNNKDYILKAIKQPFDLIQFLYINGIINNIKKIYSNNKKINDLISNSIFTRELTYLKSFKINFLNKETKIRNMVNTDIFDELTIKDILKILKKITLKNNVFRNKKNTNLIYNDALYSILNKTFTQFLKYIFAIATQNNYRKLNSINEQYNTICE